MSPCDCNLPEWECELLTREEKSDRAKAEDLTPTPIDQAGIRPGDVVRISEEVTVVEVGGEYGPVVSSEGKSGRTWHLVHRPDPDAEAVEALRQASWSMRHAGERVDPLPGLPEAADMLSTLREQGWDVTRRQS